MFVRWELTARSPQLFKLGTNFGRVLAVQFQTVGQFALAWRDAQDVI